MTSPPSALARLRSFDLRVLVCLLGSLELTLKEVEGFLLGEVFGRDYAKAIVFIDFQLN